MLPEAAKRSPNPHIRAASRRDASRLGFHEAHQLMVCAPRNADARSFATTNTVLRVTSDKSALVKAQR